MMGRASAPAPRSNEPCALAGHADSIHL